MPAYSGRVLRSLASHRKWHCQEHRVLQVVECGLLDRESASRQVVGENLLTVPTSSASVCAHIHHNDVMVGKFCSIRFSASRVVAVDRINFQRRSPWTSALQSRVVELFGPERRADVFWVTIGDGLPTQAFTNPKRLAGCLSTFYCGTKVPGDQRRSVAHRSTRSDVAVGPQCHSPIAIDRALWEPGPWSSALFGHTHDLGGAIRTSCPSRPPSKPCSGNAWQAFQG